MIVLYVLKSLFADKPTDRFSVFLLYLRRSTWLATQILHVLQAVNVPHIIIVIMSMMEWQI